MQGIKGRKIQKNLTKCKANNPCEANVQSSIWFANFGFNSRNSKYAAVAIDAIFSHSESSSTLHGVTKIE